MLLLAACRIGSAAIAATPPLPAATATPIVIVATPTPLSDADLLPIDIEEQLITNLYERVGPSAHPVEISHRSSSSFAVR